MLYLLLECFQLLWTLPISLPLWSPLPRRLLYPLPGDPFLFCHYFLFVSSIVYLGVYKSYFLQFLLLGTLSLLLLPLSQECKLLEGRKGN